VRRFHPTRLQLLLGLVVVLLATVPVLIPLVWTNASETTGPDALRAAAAPGVPALPQADAASAPAPATEAAPAGAGELAPALPATPSPSPTTPSPTPAPSTTVPPSADPTPTPDPATSTPDATDGPAVLSAGADLVVVSVSWSPQPSGAGQPVVFAAVVRNTGSDATPTVTHSVAFSVDGTEVTWSANSSAPLAPGEERTYTADGGVSGNVWSATSGAHTVQAWVDDQNLIPEISEDDNTATAALVVP
jgi:CARDB